jgi:hypothetical protein
MLPTNKHVCAPPPTPNLPLPPNAENRPLPFVIQEIRKLHSAGWLAFG